MPACPVCSSEMVYPLLNTLRCKRCKHIWKVGDEQYSTCRCPDLVPSLRVRKKTDPLEIRLEKKLDELLARHGGKICITTMSCRYGDLPFELFRSYLKRCVRDRTLIGTTDRYGRTWYERPG
jgi:hypothetical protein